MSVAYKSPEDRLGLTVDSINEIDLHKIDEVFKGRIRKVKLGIVFGRASHTSLGLGDMIDNGIEVTFDGKFSETARQMPNAIMSYEEDGYNRLTVNAGATVTAIEAAALSSRNSEIVLALPADQPNHIEEELDKLEAANQNLSDRNRIKHLMCDVGGIALARARGDYTIIATGIYAPGTNPVDVESRLLPSQALELGADELYIGRAITYPLHITTDEAVDRILIDISKVL